MAEAVLRDRLEQAGLSDAVEVDSAGTGHWHVGNDADPRALATLANAGYDLRHAARQFESHWLERSDLILAMDRQNLRDLRALAERHGVPADHVRLFRSFDSDAEPDPEVPDPYYGGDEGFTDVLRLIERASDGIVAHVQGELDR